MFKNYFKIAWRNLLRNKGFSFINITGLAVGLATCLLIMLYIAGERGYDSHHNDAESLYRIATIADQLGSVKSRPWAATSAPIAWALKSDLSEVEQVTRLLKFPSMENLLLTYNDDNSTVKQFYETNGYYVDSTFFQVFTYEFRYGDVLTALNEPNSVVLSEDVAGKLFGDRDPVGQSITIGIPYGNFSYTVKGVYKNAGIRSHIPARFFLSMRNRDIGAWVDQQTNWATNNIFHTYIKLKPGIDPVSVEQKLQPFLDRRGGTDMKALGISKTLFMQPVPDIYLHSDLDNEIVSNGNATYLYILGGIALFVLLIACINFMNLSTARSGKRAKEIGVRKVVGAGKLSLIRQFLGESLVMSGLALVLAIVLTWLFLPWFNNLTQKNLQLSDDPQMLMLVVLLTIFTGLLSGLYPAFYLSSFKPVNVLKGKLLHHFSAIVLRKGLVVLQFTISICLVVGTIVIARQLHYLDNQPMGFNKEQQLILPLQSQEARDNYTVLKNELLKIPAVTMVTGGSTYPGIATIEDMLFYPEGKTIDELIDVYLANVDHDYFETLGLTLLSGRGFSKEFTADSNSIVLNEAAIKEFGFDVETAIGKKIQFDFRDMRGSFEIIGVVRNFNFQSLYNSIKPFGFNTYFGDRHSYVIANVSTTDYAALLERVASAWKDVNPNIPFMYSFLDSDFQRNYERDRRASGMVVVFTVIAIAIACLGLFGLAAFSAEQRTKEIGIRKVLGATVGSIVGLLSKDFIKLVLIAILVASPVAWWAMNRWLEDFAYRIDIEWWMFALAGLASVAIALLTVGGQAIRAAVANPVKSLRTE